MIIIIIIVVIIIIIIIISGITTTTQRLKSVLHYRLVGLKNNSLFRHTCLWDILHKRFPHTQFERHNGIILLILLNLEGRKVPIQCL